MKTEILAIYPVIPSQDVNRDVTWYEKYTGFKAIYSESMYAVLKWGTVSIHLQWHADTEEDPLLGGSVVRIFVKNLEPIYNDLLDKGTITPDKLQINTAWNSNEFGFYDLNKNAIFIAEEAKS